MKRSQGIAYLVNADPGAMVPCSRYGRNTEECAPVAWRLAYLISKYTHGLGVDRGQLDYAMSLVVNDHDDVADTIRQYGDYKYR